ncbi:MAG: sensor histidine kinase [Cytophagaceae bacterium]
MKFHLKFLILLSFFSLILQPSFSKEDPVKVIVMEESEAPVEGAIVIIDDNTPCKTDKSGKAIFTPAKKLKMPLTVKLEKSGFEMKEFLYYEDDKEIEVIVKKVSPDKESFFVYVLSGNKSPIKGVSVKSGHTTYVSDANGLVKIPSKNFDADLLIFNGYTGVLTESKGKNYYFALAPVAVAKAVEKPKSQDTLQVKELIEKDLTPEELEEVVFNQYKNDFESITGLILEERHRIEENNNKIREEIISVTERLRTEKNLSPEKRKELELYVQNLEKTLYENALAYQKAEEKTLLLIDKLKRIIQEKDSLNEVAMKKFEIAEKQRILVEKKSKRNLIIFSIISSSLLLLAVVFYSISMKMRKQKKGLLQMNEDLQRVQAELALRLEEISKQKELIEEQNHELDMFVYKASHDIKGPLKSLLGLTKVGVKTVQDQNSIEIFNHINKSIDKLDLMVSDLLELSRAKKAEVHKTNVNIRSVLDQVIESFKNFDGFDRMKFEVNIPESTELMSDHNMIHSILQNFVENAIKYSDKSKETSYLKINISENEECFEISFEDNGLGISKDNASKIFDMFYKVNEGSIGTGLGLYIVKHNIEKLNGKVQVESQEGVGSKFTVRFTKEVQPVLLQEA